jgi:hypothetical protein
MIVETIVGLSAIYFLAKAQKPQAKTMVQSKAPALLDPPIASDLPLIKTAFTDVTLENMITPEVSFPKPATGIRTVEGDLIIEKDVIENRVAEKPPVGVVPTSNQLGFYRFFQTPEALAFAAKMRAIGFEDATVADSPKWSKFFFWLRFDEMPDVNNKLTGLSSSEQVRFLMNEAQTRNLLTDASFERLKKYMAPVKGSTTIVNQSVAEALAEYKRKATEQANMQLLQAKEQEALRVLERDRMLAAKAAAIRASMLGQYSSDLQTYRTGSWTAVRDLINKERRSALTPTAFERVSKESPIVGGATENLPNAIVMPDGYAFLPDNKRFAYFTSPDGTVYYATVVYAVPGRSSDPIIAGRVVSAAEYNNAKNFK